MPATFVIKRSEDDDKTYALFDDIILGGAHIKDNTYELERGSLVIKLKADYLDTLVTGKYRLTIKFKDGEATAFFRIDDPSDKTIPSTGGSENNSNGTLWSKLGLPKMGDGTSAAMLVMVTVIGAFLVLVGATMRRQNK